MKLSDFDYSIPEDLIAQQPLEHRDISRLLVINRKKKKIEHGIFSNLTDHLIAGDLLILNDTRVIPVRLSGKKTSGGRAELTLLRELETNRWEALVKGVNYGTVLLKDNITAKVNRLNESVCIVEFSINSGRIQHERFNIRNCLSEIGTMPLPVYIKRQVSKSDFDQYQTVYAKKEGAVAAPTAGLHFTDTLLNNLRKKGTDIKTVTLHVGYGTFRPVKVSNIKDHRMDEELLQIPEETAEAVNSARSEGRRVIAVGTTVTRALEAFADSRTGRLNSGSGTAGIFIFPGHKFRVIDALITNFHLPRSTPMMLTSAFAGLELLKKSYKTAISEKYRFFSYGDAMFIQ